MLRRSFCLFCLGVLSGNGRASEAPRIVCGTTLISDIVKSLLPEAKVLVLAQSSSCPTHADIKMADVIFTRKSNLILVHGFQQNFPTLHTLFDAAKNPDTKVRTLDETGNWMTPPVQIQASEHIAEILMAAFAPYAGEIRRRLQARIQRIKELNEQIKEKLDKVSGCPVVASTRQADFLQWANIPVAADYMTADDISPRALIDVLGKLKNEKVCAVVDNRQSGADMGEALARELHVPHIVLSNFPTDTKGEEDYFALLDSNVGKLLKVQKQ